MKIELNPVKWFGSKSGDAAASPVAAADGNVAAVRSGQKPPMTQQEWAAARAARVNPLLQPIPSVFSVNPKDVVFQESSNSAKAVEGGMNKFVGFLEAIGKDFEKGLGFAVHYAVPVEKLVALLFPAVAPEMMGVVTATSLIQTAVISVEQKYAAAGVQNGTGSQKAAEVLTLTEQAVIALLKQDGITADTSYVQSIISAVVGILNMQTAPATVAAKAA